MEDNYTETEFKTIASKEISVAYLSYLECDLIQVQFFDDITIGIPEVKELANATKELTGGIVPVLSLVITGQRNNISTEAFSYNIYTELNITQRTIAEAVVIQNLPTRIIANFYYKVVPRPFPVKVFESREKAIAWLMASKAQEPSS